MLNVGLRVLVGISIVASVGCGGSNSKKMSISKGARTRQQAGPEAFKEAMGAEKGGCLKVDAIARIVQSFDLVSIHTSDLEFVDVSRTQGRELTEAERKAGKVRQERVQFPRIEDADDAVKAAYFLKPGQGPVIIAETLPGKDVATGSVQLAGLLNIAQQETCAKVIFNERGIQRQFQVIEASRNGIKLENSQEYRSYLLFGRNQVLISVVRKAGPMPRCDAAGRISANALERRTYLLAKSRSMDRYPVTKSLARVYHRAFPLQELLEAQDLTPQQREAQKARDEKAKGRGGRKAPVEYSDYNPLSGTTLQYIARALETSGAPAAAGCAASTPAKQ